MSRAVQALPAGVLVALCGVIVINLLWPREQEREWIDPVPPATVYEVLEHREGCEVLEEVEGADRARYFLVTPLKNLKGRATRICRDLGGYCGRQVRGGSIAVAEGRRLYPPLWGKWGTWDLPVEPAFKAMHAYCHDNAGVPRSLTPEGLISDLESPPCALGKVAKTTFMHAEVPPRYVFRVDTYDDDGQPQCQKHVELQLREVHLGGVLP